MASRSASDSTIAAGSSDDLDLLLACLPARLQAALRDHPERAELIEVVLDLGRLPEARFVADSCDLGAEAVTRDDLAHVVSHLGRFGKDNRAGIERTLHRISALRNRVGEVVGMTCRVGRVVRGTVDILRDVIEGGHSLLLLGRPGVGKTTLLREAARVLADELGKRVVVVDTSNEIAGDGDIPHHGIGRARRLQVPAPDEQHAVMIEAVENHMPEVVVIDEIGTAAEALAARTIAERGVQLVATAHGRTLDNLLQNPTLSDLVGGIQAVTLSDEEARRRGTQKTVLERKAPPTFDVLVEIHERDHLAVHHDVASTVDRLLRGFQSRPQERFRAADGQIETRDADCLVARYGADDAADDEDDEVEVTAPPLLPQLEPDRQYRARPRLELEPVAPVFAGSPPAGEPGANGSKMHSLTSPVATVGATRGSRGAAVRPAAITAGDRLGHLGEATAGPVGGRDRPLRRGTSPLAGRRSGRLRAVAPPRPVASPPAVAAGSVLAGAEPRADRARRTRPAAEGLRPAGGAVARAGLAAPSGHRFVPPVGSPAGSRPAVDPNRVLRLFPYAVSRSKLDKVLGDLGLPARLVRDPGDADVVVTVKAQERRAPQRLREVLDKGTRVAVLKANTVKQVESFLREEFALPSAGMPNSFREAQDFALREAEEAIDEVMASDRPVELAPQERAIRRLQHQLVERAGLQSVSRGDEPFRRIVVHPA